MIILYFNYYIEKHEKVKLLRMKVKIISFNCNIQMIWSDKIHLLLLLGELMIFYYNKEVDLGLN